MTSPVACPECGVDVQVPVEEMVTQTYRLHGDDTITMASVPPTLTAHLESHAD